ncbi:universal stress protein [Actinomadura sp. NPDC048394]|jgi:nucleotide-binding universal stress UspA family protein|uniref:universal stress protein n=1 Tax=Actinomadura sp. NPDC048394 TaxID=3158223 RepID=UPI00340094B1
MPEEREFIIVGADGSAPSNRAIGWAADEAARTGRNLRIVHVVGTAAHGLPNQAGNGVRALVESWNPILRTGRDLALRRRPELKVEADLIRDGSASAVLKRCAAGAAEVVIGHRGRGGFAELLLGSTALHLAGRLPVPLTIVRGQDVEPVGEVIVGLDLLEDPAPQLDHAFAAAKARGARLRALHAWRPAPLAVEAGVDLQTAANTLRSHLAAALAPWQDRYPEVKVIEDVDVGHPVAALVMASAHADLVVVGSRGRIMPIGSVSHGVIHHADCSVAIVRARG